MRRMAWGQGRLVAGVTAMVLGAIFVAAGFAAAQNAGTPANAAAAAPAGTVVEGLPNGAVDWSGGMITAQGEGAVSPSAPNAGAARLGAERAAKAAAMRNILEMVRSIRVTSETTVENAMVSNDVIKTKVEGILRGAMVIGEPVYLSDATVRVTVGVPMANAFSDAVLPATGFGTSVPKANAPVNSVWTGLVIDARGLGVKPAMAPALFDPSGAEVYDTSQVEREYAVKQGMAGYARSLDAAKANERVAGTPLVVKAVKAQGAAKADLMLSDEDAKAIREAASKMLFLAQCRVMIVLD